MARLACLLLALLPLSRGGAVLDLINLFHQYEDEIIGRGQGVNPEPVQDYDQEVEAGKPIEVHGWDDGLKLGQVSAVDVDLNDDPVIFHRGPLVWDAQTFDSKNVLKKRLVITEDTILTIDADKAKVKSSFGGGMFYMPHGLEIDKEGNTWVTDAGLHQVMKFEKGQTKPSLVLGEKFVPGSDGDHFCKPTSVAVATNGMVFVGDGYCNSRVSVFSPEGKHLHDIKGDWNVVHSLVLYEPEDVLCVADREGQKVDCVGAGLRLAQFRGSVSTTVRDVGRVYGLAGRGTALLAVGLEGTFTWGRSAPAKGVTIDLSNESSVVNTWGSELSSPHDVAISRAGEAVYVAEIATHRIRKFEVVTPAAEMF